MIVQIPVGLVEFAKEFSKAKTPLQRTQGWNELPYERRGEGDVMDTIGTLMLWRYLASHDVPVTYHLTAGMGDETDLRVKAPDGFLDINVKTSKWAASKDEESCTRCHIPIKAVELRKPLADVFAEVLVHLVEENPSENHVHLCGWIARDSGGFQRQALTTIPMSGGSRGYWIPSSQTYPVAALLQFVSLPAEGRGHFLG